MKIKMIGVTIVKPPQHETVDRETIEEHGFLYESEAFDFIGKTLRDTNSLQLTWERIERDVDIKTLKSLPEKK